MNDLATVLRQSQRGDRESLECLMGEYAADVRATVFRFSLLNDADLSHADLLQESWLRIWSQLPNFRGPASGEFLEPALRNWLRRTTRSVVLNVLDARRAAKRRPAARIEPIAGGSGDGAEPAAEGSSVGRSLADEERKEQIAAAIGRLADEGERTLIEACFFRHRSLAETARALGFSYDQARTMFAHALERLKGYLKPFDPS